MSIRRLALILLAPSMASAQRAAKISFASYFNVPSALELASARKADRIAWTSYEKGMRNVYTAAAPAFAPTRITNFLKDDGIDIGDVELSDDGSVVVFVRGVGPNRFDWNANAGHDPDGGEHAIWAANTTAPFAPRKVADGANPVLSPDGKWVLYVKDGQIYRGRVSQTAPASEFDKGDKPFIKAWGSNGSPSWSPDGGKIAFVSSRASHSLIAIYDMKTRTMKYVSPSVDFDANPRWSADGKTLLFTRRPGTPFGQQAQFGGGGIGFPMGSAYPGGIERGRGGNLSVTDRAQGGNLCPPANFGGFGGRGGRGSNAPEPPPSTQRGNAPAGLCTSTFTGGYTLSVMTVPISDVDHAKEVWHNKPNDRVIANLNNFVWTGTHLVFPYQPQGDDFERWYSIDLSNPTSDAKNITTTDGLIEDATAASVSKDGKTLYYITNAQDIEKRHLWAVPTDGSAAPRRISTDEGVNTYPQPLASGRQIATLYFDWNVPASVAVVPAATGPSKVIWPNLANSAFPASEHVKPEVVWTTAADGQKVSNTLFLPKNLRAGEKRPAIIFVHGGPVRQMMPAYHYFQFYHWAYGFNEFLAQKGYVVLSINYRGGVGYGRSFRNAPGTNSRGNSEYQDVLAGAKYLLGRADVDTARLGIYGLSYGGLLTSQALARNSDIFKAGVDFAGVHLYTPTLDTANVAYKSSAISQIDNWKSPVFLVHGDDDRNVDFAQTIGLVSLLRAHNVYYELQVIPDDQHESMLHSVWLDTWTRTERFLDRFVWNRENPVSAGGR
jgi:dipeptidyl aminopeptidase/acylaminoacyl peptidase